MSLICSECDRLFTSVKLLRKHFDFHIAFPYFCGLCTLVFECEDDLLGHDKIFHSIEKDYDTFEIVPGIYVLNVPAGPSSSNGSESSNVSTVPSHVRNGVINSNGKREINSDDSDDDSLDIPIDLRTRSPKQVKNEEEYSLIEEKE